MLLSWGISCRERGVVTKLRKVRVEPTKKGVERKERSKRGASLRGVTAMMRGFIYLAGASPDGWVFHQDRGVMDPLA